MYIQYNFLWFVGKRKYKVQIDYYGSDFPHRTMEENKIIEIWGSYLKINEKKTHKDHFRAFEIESEFTSHCTVKFIRSPEKLFVHTKREYNARKKDYDLIVTIFGVQGF